MAKKDVRNSLLNASVFIMQQAERISCDKMTLETSGTFRSEEMYELDIERLKQDDEMQSLMLI